MSRPISIQVGATYGRLTVQSLEPYMDRKQRRWRAVCRCSCGAETVLRGDMLRITQSCGCAQLNGVTKHGMHKHPLYTRWRNMLSRCSDSKDSRYAAYGGRGIKVCAEWQDPARFIADMGATFTPGLELDRIDVNGNYEPSNCRWVTHAEQARNKRNLIYIEHQGLRLTAAEWSRKLGLSYGTIWERIKVLGWDPVAAITTPVLDADERCARARAAWR